MMAHKVWAVAKADFKERMRRAPAWMAMIVGGFLCYLAVTGKATVTLPFARGVWNSAWSAGTMATLAANYLTLVCFFVVRSAIQRDEETGAGRLVAASPLSNYAYLLGKALSNFAVVLSIGSIFLLAAPVLQWVHHEGYPFNPWEFINPFLYMTVPSAALVAAVAVFFECHPWLKRGIGNVIYIFLWVESLRESAEYGRAWTDAVGFYGFMESGRAAALAQGIVLKERGLNIGHAQYDHWNIFTWHGFQFTGQQVLLRLEWFAVAAVLVFAATYFFKRFNPDAKAALRFPVPAFLKRKKKEETSGKWETEIARLSAIGGMVGKGRFFGIVRAELKLLLKSIPKFVYFLLGFANFLALMPHEKDGPTGPGVLAFLWIVPVIVWSNMGAREQAPHARPLIFSAPHSCLRQLPVEWVAGFVIALGISFGVAVRDLIARDWQHLATWLAGAAFIASLALACGTWSRGTRLFQGLYCGWWYLAMNNAPNMDFTGVTGQRHFVGYAFTAALLFASAFAQRWWSTERAAVLRVLGVIRKHPQRDAVTAQI
ncbi:hypothetical protein Acid345_2798 [Candidatus Koribacter versatilis Ellin345]|uniref:Uncharacterized protein n=1 Tax=Koribacter versatilis (strain Ellin345) TaxID=204669 RepID=Q1IMV1_KORVE|nr:hypothetical protein [Candidatus Koribacter versatilis]ABF41799.1 hypothetical protein Acid345_2798 [Candidatus Koribacter versatilis Ellin345]